MSDVIIVGIVVLAVALVGLFFFTRLPPGRITLALIALGTVFACGAFLSSHFMDRALEKRNGPRHVFELSGPPAFLAEEVALDKARAALARDGFAVQNWHPVPDGRTSAPDGRRDVYLARDLAAPSRGSLLFTNARDERFFVHLELDGNRVVCQRITPK